MRSHLSIIAIGLIIFLTAAGQAAAVRCEVSYGKAKHVKPTDQLRDQIHQGQIAIESYKAIMGLRELGESTLHLDNARHHFHRLSSTQVTELKKLIQNHYQNIKALKANHEGPFVVLKRHLDLHLSEILNAKSFFKSRLSKNSENVMEVLDDYYKQVAQMIGAQRAITAEQVLLTAYRMQEILAKHHEVREQGTELILFGSFVNGKAVAGKSDLDYAVTTARMEEILSEEKILPLLKEFQFSEVQPHLVMQKNVHELGFLNPLIVVINEESVTVRIYEELDTRELHGRRVLFDEYYP